MKRKTSVTILCLAVFAAMISSAFWNSCIALEEEEIVTFDQVPPAVQATLKRESAEGQLGEIEKESDKCKVVYEAEAILDGKKYEIEVAEDGTLLEKELKEIKEEEQEVTMNQLPRRSRQPSSGNPRVAASPRSRRRSS